MFTWTFTFSRTGIFPHLKENIDCTATKKWPNAHLFQVFFEPLSLTFSNQRIYREKMCVLVLPFARKGFLCLAFQIVPVTAPLKRVEKPVFEVS